MNPVQFFEKVAEMREAQREYFRTRSKEAFIKSKQTEREIDSEIERVKAIRASNPTTAG